MSLKFKSTADIKIPKGLADQIVGQEEAVIVIKKAAKQRRNVLLIGEPGIGKSLTGQALAELLSLEKLTDIVALPNPGDDNNPLVRELPKGEGKLLMNKAKAQSASSLKTQNIIFFILIILAILSPWWIRRQYGDIMAAASLIGSMIFVAAFVLFMNLSKRMKVGAKAPKLLVDNHDKKKSPFVDATGAHAGALLGDVLHDPLQSLHKNSNINVVLENKSKVGVQNILQIKRKSIGFEVDKLLKNKQIIREKKYQARFLENDELKVFGEKDNEIKNVEVLSVNKYPKVGELIKVTTESGKQLIVTPEHKVAVKKFGKIKYKSANKLTNFDRVVSVNF